jgi:AcrR family transcriptional regulator
MASLKVISNSPRKGNRARSSEAKEEKRQGLLRSALELFTQNGYRGTSIEMITERAGVSTGTFYLYYRNKVELYRILNTEAAGILRKLIEEAIAWPGMTSLAQLSAVARAFFRFYSEFRGYYDILSVLHIGQKDFGSYTEMLVPLENQTIAILKLVEAILKRGIESGELTETDTWQTTTALWGMMDGIILLDVKQNLELIGKPIQEVFKQGLEIVLRGLSKPSDKGNQ